MDSSPRLTLHLFGPGVLATDGVVVRLHSSKALALLAYLALEAGRPHPRPKLAALLWGDGADASSRQGLRQALYSLNGVAGGRLQHCLAADRDSVRLVPGDALDVDVHRFVAGARSGDPAQWRVAASLYRAPLLDAMAFDGCESFDTWLAGAREDLRALAMHNLDRLVADCSLRADQDGALEHALALRDLDPTSESSSRRLLRVLAERGEARALDAEWARLRGVFARELGVEPSAQTAELYAMLRRGDAGPAATRGAGSLHIPDGRPADEVVSPSAEVESYIRAGRAAERVYGFSQALDLYEWALKVLERASSASAARRVDVLLLAEAALERLGRRAEQASAIDAAVALAEGLGDSPRLAAALLRRAGVCAYLGRCDGARAAAMRAMALYRALGDHPGEAEALRELGFVCWQGGDHRAALRYARDALELHRRLGDVAGEASALHNLAELHRTLGSPRQAIELYEQALRLHWACGNPVGEILSLYGEAGALDQARECVASDAKYDAALRLSETHGERTMQARTLHAMAARHAAHDELDDALGLMRRTVEVDRVIGYGHALGHDLVDLAGLHLRRGERSEARAALGEALIWFGFNEDRDAQASTRALLDDLDAGLAAAGRFAKPRRSVKSHFTLGEGKVYCEFESPLGSRPAR